MESLVVVNQAKHPSVRDDGAYVFHHPPKFMWEPATRQLRHQWGSYTLYVHVPFCRRFCTFCTFERRHLRKGSLEWFAEKLADELRVVERLDDFRRARANALYFGGGTASLLPNQTIVSLIEAFRGRFGLQTTDVEVTLECEPGNKTTEDYRELLAAGVSRVSIGVQAFQDHHLRNLNRSHDADGARATIQAALDAGFDNVHIDLMYGLPGQTIEEWDQTLSEALRSGINHISAYRLIVFRGELLDRTMAEGRLQDVPELSVVASMSELAARRLRTAGFSRYSLTEYTRERSKQCQYVRSNWDGSDYLGFGPGAYSRNGRRLWENHLLHSRYHEDLVAEVRPVGRQWEMSAEQALIRDIAMGFCLLKVDVENLSHRLGADLPRGAGETLRGFVADGLLRQERGGLKLTAEGIRYATHVMKSLTEAG